MQITTPSSNRAGARFRGFEPGEFGFKPKSEMGFSLTELLVAGVLMGLVTLSMVSVLRVVKGMEYSDMHRRQAKALIDSCFETQFHHSDYITAQPETVTVTGIIIDPREDGVEDDLTGTLVKQVSKDTMTVERGGIETEFETKTMILNLSWEEPEEGPQEITLSKEITSLP